LAEKLATAVESRDGRTLSDVADEIELIARDDGMTKLADQAQSLGKAAQNGENWESVVKQSVGVLAECRDPRRQDPADSEISPAMTV
jgi:hypothetical protein